MIIKIISVLTIVLMLQACGGESQSVNFSSKEAVYLLESTPLNKQAGVAINDAIVLTFSKSIFDETLLDSVRLMDQSLIEVDVNVELDAEDERTIIIMPVTELKYDERYFLDYSALLIMMGGASSSSKLEFRTISEENLVNVQPMPSDPDDLTPEESIPDDPDSVDPDPVDPEPVYIEQDTNGDGLITVADTLYVPVEYDTSQFYVVEAFPSDTLPYLDVSVFHFTLSQEIDPTSIALDDGFRLTKAGGTTSIAGTLFVKGRHISFDPDEDLEPDIEYTLVLGSSVKSTSGLHLNAGEFAAKTFEPRSTMPRLNIVQKVFGEMGGPVSPVNNATRNSVSIHSKLIGENLSYAQGDYHIELAQVGQFPENLPFVIRKGSLIKLSSMDVNIGGAFPAGFSTEDIELTLISDAVGYLTEHASGTGFNRKLSMVMDAAMTAQNSLANGTLSQNVLNVNLGGLAVIDNGVLAVDAIGDISITLLGFEDVPSTASFFLQGYASHEVPPEKVVDTKAPVLHSWVPGDFVNRSELNSPILMTFSEPLAMNTLDNNIQLIDGSGVQHPVTITQDGGTLIIKPTVALESNTQYEVLIGPGLTDLAGNSFVNSQSFVFTTQYIDSSVLTAPLISSVYPGFNCRLTDGDLSNDIAGRCSGGLEGDDLWNIFSLPSNRSIQVNFSQLMNKNTISLSNTCDQGSFRVEKINTDGDCLGVVPGAIQFNQIYLEFIPSEPWQEGQLYQYEIFTDKTSSCTGSDNVPCSIYGVPLNTKPLKLKLSNRTEGSHSIRMPFYAVAPRHSHVLSIMNQVPTSDANRNYTLDGTETVITENAAKLWVGGTTGLVSEARLGCQTGACAQAESIYVSGQLPTDIGEYDVINNRIPVTIYPQALMTTSITMYAKTFLGWLENPTGPQVMRVRADYEGGKSTPNTGYIVWDEEHGQAYFESTMNVYLDAPGLAPKIIGIELPTNMHSLPLTLKLKGPVSFLADGRMEINLSNTEMVDIDVLIESFLGDSDVFLKIPKGALSINLVSNIIK